MRIGNDQNDDAMKLRLKLSSVERRTLREMGIVHPHARTRMQAQGMFRLAQGLTLQQVADEFEVHLNSVENWRQRWNQFGLVGLFEGRHTGRPPKLSDEERRRLGDLARDAGGTAKTLQRQWEREQHAPLSRNGPHQLFAQAGLSLQALPPERQGHARRRGVFPRQRHRSVVAGHGAGGSMRSAVFR
jgi:transposase